MHANPLVTRRMQLKLESECARGCRASVLILGERLTDDLINARRNIPSLLPERRGIGFAMPNEKFGRCSRKRRLSGQHLIGYHSQAVDVRTLVESFSTALFRRHVLRRSHHGTEAAHLPGRVTQSQCFVFRDRKQLTADRRFAEFRLRFKFIESGDVLQAGDAEIQRLDVDAI